MNFLKHGSTFSKSTSSRRISKLLSHLWNKMHIDFFFFFYLIPSSLTPPSLGVSALPLHLAVFILLHSEIFINCRSCGAVNGEVGVPPVNKPSLTINHFHIFIISCTFPQNHFVYLQTNVSAFIHTNTHKYTCTNMHKCFYVCVCVYTVCKILLILFEELYAAGIL